MTIQVKHSRLWLPDGNIVLAGKPSPNFDNSNDEYPAGTLVQVLFCVHKSTLARQSQVFKDMLDITSEGANAGDLYDGLPLVALEDSASDLNGILQVLYDPCSPSLQRYHPDTPLIVEPILRMAAKYQFDNVRTRIVEHIKADWPSNLREWKQFESHIKALCRPLDDNSGLPVLDLLIPEPAAAICLAHRFDIPQILPAAFFALSTMRVAHDYDRHRAIGDAGLAVSMTADVDEIGSLERTARWKLLDARDMRVLCKIREYLQVDIWSMIKYAPEITCKYTCEGNHRNAIALLQKQTLESGDVLFAMHSNPWGEQPAWCHNCKTRIASQLVDAQTKIWPALTAIVKME